MTVSLVSTTRRLAVFVLSHTAYCAALGSCSCARRRDGALIAGSLTIPARAHVPDLPDAVLAVPAIALAIRMGELRVKHAPAAEAAPDVVNEGGPQGAPTTPVEVSDERRAPLVQSRRR